jgi:hypothetical protein
MKKYVILLCLLSFACISAFGCSDRNDNGNESDSIKTDIDLTVLSATLVEAEYNNILSNFDNYEGKTIKASGTYYSLFFEQADRHLHYIIIVPGDECCQLGFEFIRDGEYAVPDDYPVQNAGIEIIGVLGRYEEHGSRYPYIAVKEINIIS